MKSKNEILEILKDIKKSIHANDIIYNRKEFKYGSDITYEEFEEYFKYGIKETNNKERLVSAYFEFYDKYRRIAKAERSENALITIIKEEKDNIFASVCKNKYYEIREIIKKETITLDEICACAYSAFYEAINNYDFDKNDNINVNRFESYASKYVIGEIESYRKDMSILPKEEIKEVKDVNKIINKMKEFINVSRLRAVDILLFNKMSNLLSNETIRNSYIDFTNKRDNLDNALILINQFYSTNYSMDDLINEIYQIESVLSLRNNSTAAVYDEKSSDIKEEGTELNEENWNLLNEIADCSGNRKRIFVEGLSSYETECLWAFAKVDATDDFIVKYNLSGYDEYNKILHNILIRFKEE